MEQILAGALYPAPKHKRQNGRRRDGGGGKNPGVIGEHHGYATPERGLEHLHRRETHIKTLGENAGEDKSWQAGEQIFPALLARPARQC